MGVPGTALARAFGVIVFVFAASGTEAGDAKWADSEPPYAVHTDFTSVPLLRIGTDYFAFLESGRAMPCGPALTLDNAIYCRRSGDGTAL